MTQRYMDHKEATEYLGISKGALYQLVKKRWIPYGKRGSKLIFDRVRLDNWVQACHKIYGVEIEEAVETLIKRGNLL